MTASRTSSAPPVLLIHGIASSTDALWRKAGWIEDLEAAGRVVIGIDLPGHGASKGVVDRDPVDLLLEEASKYGSVDAIGFSIGAWVLLAAAGERPALFGRIAVLGAGDMVLTEELHAAAKQQPMAEALRSSGEPTDNPMAMAILAIITDAGNDRNAVADFITADNRFPTIQDLSRIRASTLVVESNADPVGPSDLIARTISNSERLVIDGAEHFELPTRADCIAAVTSFIDKESR